MRDAQTSRYAMARITPWTVSSILISEIRPCEKMLTFEITKCCKGTSKPNNIRCPSVLDSENKAGECDAGRLGGGGQKGPFQGRSF